MFNEQYERLAQWATTAAFADEVEEARARFFEATGNIHEDDASFENRMTAFSEYYLLERPLREDGMRRTPVKRFLDEEGAKLLPEVRKVYESLAATRPGLFELRRLKKYEVKLRDLFTREIVFVQERRRLAGVEVGDIFQARLVPHEQGFIFGRVFIFHPREVRKLLLKEVKRRRKSKALEDPLDRTRLLAILAKNELRLERQARQNLARPDPLRVYSAALQ